MKKKIISVIAALTMALTCLCGCGAADESENTGLANTEKVDSALKNAQATEDSEGFVYTGEAPITKSGGTLKILAQTSNYNNVEIDKAPIVLKVFEEAGVKPDFTLIKYDDYAFFTSYLTIETTWFSSLNHSLPKLAKMSSLFFGFLMLANAKSK